RPRQGAPVAGALPRSLGRRGRSAPEPSYERRGHDIDPHQAAELAARVSYGRLVAYLAARWRDVARAEDALGDALLAALETWPRTGVPDTAEAWLLTAARRRLVDGARHAKVTTAAEAELTLMFEERTQNGAAALPDPR